MSSYDIQNSINNAVQQVADGVQQRLNQPRVFHQRYADTDQTPVTVTARIQKVAEDLTIEEALPVLRKNRKKLMLVKSTDSGEGYITKYCFLLTEKNEFLIYKAENVDKGTYVITRSGASTRSAHGLIGFGLLDEDWELCILPKELRS